MAPGGAAAASSAAVAPTPLLPLRLTGRQQQHHHHRTAGSARLMPAAGVLLVLAAAAAAAASVPGAAAAAPSWLPSEALQEGGGVLAPDAVAAWQDALLAAIYQQHKDQCSYCVGAQLEQAQRLLRESFPTPLPSGPASEPACSSTAAIAARLCSPRESVFYYKYLLLTNDPEKLPTSPWCSGQDSACAPGFFRPTPLAVEDAGSAHPCCPGYFCPAHLTCLMPCPLGAFCPRAWPLDPPPNYLPAADAAGDDARGLLPVPLPLPAPGEPQQQGQQWCAPFAYAMRPALGCGGADKWPVEPVEPFPRRWDWPASGGIFCTGGHFCPNTTTMLPCEAGHFCKPGSSSMTRCPPLLGCPPGTESATDNWLGLALDAALFLLLAVLWQAVRLVNQLSRRLEARERVAVAWGGAWAPEVTVVEEEAGGGDQQQPAPPPPTALQSLAGGGGGFLWSSSEVAPAQAPGGVLSEAARLAASKARGKAEAPQAGGGWLPLARTLRLPGGLRVLCSGVPQLLRRRSSGSGRRAVGSAGGIGSRLGSFAMSWAVLDEGGGDEMSQPLLAWEMHAGGSSPGSARLLQHPAAPARLPRGSGDEAEVWSGKAKQQRLSCSSSLDGADDKEHLIPAGSWPGCEAARSISSSNGPDRPGEGHAPPWAAGQPAHQLAGGDGGLPQPHTLDVCFEGLGLRLKSCSKVVLQDVTGRLETGRLAAIMGPSGAGKSSLLAMLAGRAHYGIVSGRVLINGRPDDLRRHRRALGFVPQADTMHRLLTVDENFAFAACLRLPAGLSARQRRQLVNETITVLGLQDVRHSVIGDEEVRGISGGQAKRVNVGLELVARPSVLLLDEPTSGLDSAAAKQLVQRLQHVARSGSGVTVAAVVHQPAYEALQAFDDLLLLAKGGRTAYAGTREGVQPYFESLGFELPQHVNPADVLLDILSGAVLPTARVADGSPRQAVDVAAAWQQRQGQAACTADAAPAAASASASPVTQQQPTRAVRLQRWRQPWVTLAQLPHTLLLAGMLAAAGVRDAFNGVRDAVAEQLLDAAAAIASRRGGAASVAAHRSSRAARPPGFCRQFVLVLSRAILMRTREPLLSLTENAIWVLVGLFVGVISDRGRASSVGSFVGNAVYGIVAIGMCATISGVRIFGGPDRLVFYREASTGLNKLAYFCALDVWSLVGMLLRSALYLGMYATFSQPRAVAWQLYAVTCSVYYSCQGQAFLFSQVMSPNAAQLAAAVSALINALVASKFATTGALGVMNQCSFARWGLEGLVIAEVATMKGVWLPARCAYLASFSYDINRFWLAVRVLLGIGVVSRLAALIAMLTLHRAHTT